MSAAVLRAISASREEFGSHVLPGDAAKGSGKALALELTPPELIGYATDGERILPFDACWGQPDQVDPNFDPHTGESRPAPAADADSDSSSSQTD